MGHRLTGARVEARYDINFAYLFIHTEELVERLSRLTQKNVKMLSVRNSVLSSDWYYGVLSMENLMMDVHRLR